MYIVYVPFCLLPFFYFQLYALCFFSSILYFLFYELAYGCLNLSGCGQTSTCKHHTYFFLFTFYFMFFYITFSVLSTCFWLFESFRLWSNINMQTSCIFSICFKYALCFSLLHFLLYELAFGCLNL